MSALAKFAEWFKARKTPIRAWYEDEVGRFAFKVIVDGTPLICVAHKKATASGETSIMKKVAGVAQTRDALVAVRFRDEIMVFDPVSVLDQGECGSAVDDNRRKRGEEWVYFGVDLGCDFESWYDGYDTPVRYGAATVDY